jgi:glycosyltransferase involved in cell wall biosynthesis
VGYLIDAFISVVRERPEFYMVFTGSVNKQDQKKVMDTMTKAGVPERVIFSGMLRRTELVWAYQHAIGLLCCRTNSPYANFGFPTKVGEYLAAGAPVIATRVGDVGIYLQHEQSALLAEPENVKSIAQCMQFIIDNPEAAKKIGRQGQMVAKKNFHYPCYAESIAEFVRGRI